jgi:hypothetical protein
MRTNVGARIQILVIAAAASLWSMPVLAQAPARLSDKDVKALLEQVDEGRDKFEGNLDGTFKGSTIRGPAGERKVSVALQDYQDNTKKLKERFTADYSASAEVATVLKQSNAIDTFMRAQPSDMKGRSEWDRQVVNLTSLAKAYGGVFPLPEGAAIRRMNDKEVAGVAESLAAAADRFKNDINKDAALAKPDKDAAKKDVEVLAKQANSVKSRVSDGQPATAEVRQVIEQIAKIQTFVIAHPNTVVGNWQAVQTSSGKLQQAFGLMP